MATQRYSLDIKEAGRNWVPRPTLSSADYAGQEVWEQEKEHIWWGDWICAGRTEEIPKPGDYIVRDIAGESVFVVRTESNELRGFYNVCSHRGAELVAEPCHVGAVLRCRSSDYFGTGCRERFSDGGTDASCGSGNQGDSVFHGVSLKSFCLLDVRLACG